MKATRWGAGSRMGELTDDQLRQIAASSGKGISESVHAAEVQGAANESASAFARELGAEIGSWVQEHQGMPANKTRVILVVGAVGLGAYFLLRRKKHKGPK